MTPGQRNGSTTRYDIGALEQRVFGLEQGISQLYTNMAQQNTNLSGQISNLSTKLDERAKIPWPALGVMLTFLTIVGGLVWYPVKDSQGRMETALIKFADTTPTNKEIESSAKRRDDWQRYAEDRFKRMEQDADATQKAIVPRGEHEEKWRGADNRFTDIQRQVDSIKSDFSGLYSPRDALTSMQKRLEDIERRVLMSGRPLP